MERRRCWAAFAALVLLAGCGSDAETAGPGLPAPPSVEARFVPGRSVNIITVTASDPLALRSADLIGPGGVAVPASSIETGRAPAEPVAPGVDAFPPIPGMSVPTARVDTVLSTALIQLPEPVLYVHDWRQYRIRLRFANPGGQSREVMLPAPAPPPNEGG
jgi:hypothetical protein